MGKLQIDLLDTSGELRNTYVFDVIITRYGINKARNVVFTRTAEEWEAIFQRGNISVSMMQVDFSGTTGYLYRESGGKISDSDMVLTSRWKEFEELEVMSGYMEEAVITFPDSKDSMRGVITHFQYGRDVNDPGQIEFKFTFLAYPYEK